MSTLSEVKAHVKYWQKQLRMLDWVFEVKIHDDPDVFKLFGSMRHHLESQSALLEILEPSKIKPEWAGCRDLEVTVVHELIHTRFILAIRSKKYDPNLEIAIETTAKSLVANRRGISLEELI